MYEAVIKGKEFRVKIRNNWEGICYSGDDFGIDVIKLHVSREF
jgi:hypothetical protein